MKMNFTIPGLKGWMMALAAMLFLASCQRELSFENGVLPNQQSGTAVYTFSGAPSNCTNAVISGAYTVSTALIAGNTVTISVNVATIGTYTLTTNTNNGIQFSASGTFTATGPQTITMTGVGTPVVAGAFSFNPGTAGCTFTITCTPAGTSGGTSAYTFAGAPSNCTAAVIGGTYVAGTALTATDTVVLSVDVTTVGTYTVSTATVNGISFATSGTFTATGPQTIKLTGTGTPAAGGVYSFTPGSTGCSFSVTVTGLATAGCKDCEYYPVCVTSRYTYADTINGTTNTVTSTLVNSNDTIIGGVTFQKLEYSSTPATQGSNNVAYHNCASGVTTLKSYSSTTFNGNTVLETTIRLLQANAAVGATWTDSIAVPGGGGQSNIYNFTLAEKGISRVVAGVTYNNVIHVSLSNGVDFAGTFQEYSVTDYYYAKGIGLIESSILNTQTGTVTLHKVLLSYFIP